MILRNSFTQTCLAFGRPMWTRYRKDFIWMAWGTLAAIVVTTVLSNIPVGMFGFSIHVIRAFKFTSSGCGIMLYLGCYGLATKVGSNFEPGVDARRISVLTYTLPITTRDLVLAPMIVGSLSVVAFWVVFWLLAVLPYGSPVPLILPVMITCLMISSSHAVSWIIFVRGGIGCLLSMISVIAPIFAIIGMLNHVSLNAMSLAAATLTAISVQLALQYAPISRNSVTTSFATAAIEKRAQKDAKRTKRRELPTLSNPLAAQTWFYKVYKLDKITIVFVAIAAVILLIRIPISTSDFPLTGSIRILPEAYEFWNLLPVAGFIAVLFMTVIGMTANGMPTKGQKSLPPLPTFSAIRPITTAQLVVSQAAVAFNSALAASYVVWISSVLWTLSPVEVGGKTLSMFNFLISEATPSRILLVLLTAAFFPFVIFSLQMASVARSRLPLRLGKILGFFPSVFIFGFVEVAIISRFPSWEAFGNFAQTLLPAGILLLCIKAVLIPIAQRKLEQNRLISRETFFKCAGGWIASFVVLTGAFYVLIPSGYISLVQISILIALIIPANRMLWQIYCLDLTRHVGATK